MPLEVTFTLDDQDLDYFRDVMNKAQDAAESLSEIDVVKRAQAMLDEVRNDVKAPQFVLQRLGRLQSLISMLDDADWPLAESEHQDVISALAYFYHAKDLIDDSLPVLGLLDDAIMIELVVREMQNEISAYEEFCRFRSSQESLSGKNISREDWLNSKRREIRDNMRERMARRHRGGGGGRFTRFSFFG
ncbi:MAG: DUF1232 domain-containing protein [Gammaproteobacteria bacterium]|nr:DUF1232 domain-containing protein [Gammaproteobacteria bacterium]MBP6051500.1 DUF1232 domain-containing protein [Pseudomonadales bacterium]MBK6582649.1 DUF1232 domain-containing protein [Gammaproteobacteria bacterium]MBK7167923.1 DUF1232 domain-containing protein [Gammaproteobacteria bacterium]MBK7518781.1 DUF1232 domain-containing protein [Gammaproteobacteria bacterium]